MRNFFAAYGRTFGRFCLHDYHHIPFLFDVHAVSQLGSDASLLAGVARAASTKIEYDECHTRISLQACALAENRDGARDASVVDF
jgi:hypothetical protein